MGYLGFATACGDVNGDGFADVILGAYNAPQGDNVAAGEVYLFTGRTLLLGERNLAQANGVFQGKKAYDGAGYALAVGDLNGDGYGDLIIGAPGANKSAGEIYVMMGNPALLGVINLEVASLTLQGIDKDDKAGVSLASGDVNQDGYADIIIGASGANNGAGEVYVVFGGSALSGRRNLSGADVMFLGINQGDGAGTAVAAGDVTGDGVAEVVIGAPYSNKEAGAVYVCIGKKNLIGTNNLSGIDMILEGKNAGDQTGSALACGDVNGDGYEDIVIGAPQASPGNVTNAGETYVVFGANHLPNLKTLAFADVSFQGINAGDQSGYAVCTADLNHDRCKEVIIGAITAKRGDKEVGEIYFFHGRPSLHGFNDLTFSYLHFKGKVEGCEAGCSVAGGDINRDGFEDVIIGAGKMPEGDLIEAGEAYIVFGLGL